MRDRNPASSAFAGIAFSLAVEPLMQVSERQCAKRKGEGMRRYVAVIHKADDSDFGVSFPDLPGVVTAGRTIAEARKLAEQALAFHVEGLIEDGEPVPEPTPPEHVMADKDTLTTIQVRLKV